MLKIRIKEEMKALGISQKALGDSIGVSQEAIQKILSGTTSEPKRIVEIAQCLKVKRIW
jgi:transcriptional regulator with XRE-family HTH domain